MTSKPLPFLLPKGTKFPRKKLSEQIAQRGEVKRMTIVAGFSGAGGAILCADTQETVSGYAKREVEKIHVWKASNDAGLGYNYGVAVAADSGPYADSLTQELRLAIREVRDYDLSAIDKAIEQCLTKFHSTHIWPRASQDRAPQLESLVVIQNIRGGHAEFFHTSETAVNYVDQTQCCIGIGGYLADYIVRKTLTPGASMGHMLAVAAYMLLEVRENVDGCGKGTIWWFDRQGNCDLFYDPSHRQTFLEDQAGEINVALARCMAYMTDVGDDAHPFHTDPDELLKLLNGIRANNSEALQKELSARQMYDRLWDKLRAANQGDK